MSTLWFVYYTTKWIDVVSCEKIGEDEFWNYVCSYYAVRFQIVLAFTWHKESLSVFRNLGRQTHPVLKRVAHFDRSGDVNDSTKYLWTHSIDFHGRWNQTKVFEGVSFHICILVEIDYTSGNTLNLVWSACWNEIGWWANESVYIFISPFLNIRRHFCRKIAWVARLCCMPCPLKALSHKSGSFSDLFPADEGPMHHEPGAYIFRSYSHRHKQCRGSKDIPSTVHRIFCVSLNSFSAAGFSIS